MRASILSVLLVVGCTQEPPPPPVPVDPAPVDAPPPPPRPDVKPPPPPPPPGDPVDPALTLELEELFKKTQQTVPTVELVTRSYSASARRGRLQELSRSAREAMVGEAEAQQAYDEALQNAPDEKAKLEVVIAALDKASAHVVSSAQIGELQQLRRQGDRIQGHVRLDEPGGYSVAKVAFVLEDGDWRIDAVQRGPLTARSPDAAGKAEPAKPTKAYAEVLAESKDLVQRQKYAEAEALWTEFVLAAPSHKKANFELGRVLYLKGDLKGSKKQAEIACMQGWEDGCVQAELLKKELDAKK